MRETWRRRALAVAVVVLTLAGVAAVQAAEVPEEPPSTDEPGNLWYADPVYAPAGALATATWSAPDSIDDTQAGAPDDLPDGIPDAARAPEPDLPTPESWKFGEGFPRTSGSGRYADGAYFWSDFTYDDNGAVGAMPPTNESTGAPSFGTYQYPEPEAKRNGSDIFRVAVGREGSNSIWRVDWNTLTEAEYPIAAFTIDSDNDATTGVAAWPANAGLVSPGIDTAVVISGTKARVIKLTLPVPGVADEEIDVTSGLEVDMDARSFVLTTSAIPLDGTAVVRVASGIENKATRDVADFLSLDPAHGARPGQPNVYNVAFRDYDDEPSQTNTWYDTGQAKALTAGGDVSAFAATVDWGALDDGQTDAERLLPGYTNRWYVSSIELDQGIVDPGAEPSTSGPAAYVGRIQPYGIYVPTTYEASKPSSLTWMLHGALSSHNSTQVHPRYLESACERRNSICVSPLGRGPSGGWRTSAELDFWEVWNRVAAAYSLDPDRTILSGISMGAFGTYKIAMDHPEAFAAAVTIVGHATGSETGLDRLTNLRWAPLYARHAPADELVPIAEEEKTQKALNELGLRHIYDYQPAEDHIVVALKDGYDDVAEFMANIDKLDVVASPPVISWALKPRNAERDTFEFLHGLNRPGTWWLQGVTRHDRTATSRIEATSFAISNPLVTPVKTTQLRALGSPSPALRTVLEWQYGTAPATEQHLDASLTNISALTLDLPAANLATGKATINIVTDDPLALTLDGLAGRKLKVDGKQIKGTSTFTLAAGSYVIQVG